MTGVGGFFFSFLHLMNIYGEGKLYPDQMLNQFNQHRFFYI